MKPNVYSVLLSRLSVKSRQNESSRHARKAWKAKRPKFSFSKIVLFLTLMFLFIPLFVIVALISIQILDQMDMTLEKYKNNLLNIQQRYL